MTTKKTLILAAVLLAVSAVTTGCDALSDTDEPTTQQEIDAAARALSQRSSLEDAEARVLTVVEQIAAVGTELVPQMRWEWTRDRIRSDCAKPFDQTNGQIVYLQMYYSSTPIPEDVWPVFYERARDIAAGIGAEASQTVRSETGAAPTASYHDVNFVNPDDGTSIRVGSNTATNIAGKVGCHLPKDKFEDPIKPTK